MKKKTLLLLVFALFITATFPLGVFADTPAMDTSTGDLVVESLEDYPTVGSPDADFTKGVRIGNAVYTITDENGNDPFKETELSSNAQIMATSALGVTAVYAYPAYYEGGSYYYWSDKYTSQLWPSGAWSRVDVYPTNSQYNKWISTFNSVGKTWSHYRLRATYQLDSDTIQYFIQDNGKNSAYKAPDGIYTLTVTTYPVNGQWANNGSYQGINYQKSNGEWKSLVDVWVYTVPK
ncbi:hypothetical protein FRZ06_05305 [Anoxybacterium hadale]|uniref:Uncharacterized protein n=1 Tax=Anoxybacterium hadale TaxID=3408580 RepID=A0ACD1A8X9_9FIRM|nr:hypothetical protein FRZ06_05305 [Clostridiales bacterium]